MDLSDRKIAYFSMEIAVDPAFPTYSGGLGILAADTIRTAASLKIPMVAVTLLYRKGYFEQKLDPKGGQTENPAQWKCEQFLKEASERISVTLDGRNVLVRAWKYDIEGPEKIPIFFLDTDLPENAEWDRTLTDFLYGGDEYYRLCQEVLLGIGGIRILRAMGYQSLERYHMNEGHASFLTLELLDEAAKKAGRKAISHEDVETVRKQCVFTTHTPVPAALDKFPLDLVARVLGRSDIYEMKEIFCCEGVLNMTFLALNLSHYINGVAKRHGEISQLMFAKYPIHSITNGVYVPTWTSPSFQTLYDKHIPGWRDDNFNFRYALNLPKSEAWTAHSQAKMELIDYVNHQSNSRLDVDVLTIGFARRATLYKRAYLLFEDLERLKKITKETGPLQIIYGGKAHPKDQGGKEVIKRIFAAKEALTGNIQVVYLENYDMAQAKLLTSGVDLWLNTPKPGLEASGTSGMKAALNGIPSLSVLDGWWLEGCIEGITGWSIESEHAEESELKAASSLYQKLENIIIPMFYRERNQFIDVMLHAIALNGSFFNTQRMMHQYVTNAYFL